MASAPQVPQLPRRALRVGVTGHRDLPREAMPALRAAVADVLRRIREALDGVQEAPGQDTTVPARAVLISPLAAGADQLVAEEALALGYELAVPLPYEREAYVRELSALDEAAAQAAREAFVPLWTRAVSTLEVDAEAPATPESPPARPYEALGRLVVENSDLLLAIWDGGPGGGRGGTAHVVKSAHGMGLAVIRIHVQRPHQDPSYLARLPGAERDWKSGDVRLTVVEGVGAQHGEGLDALAGKVQELVAPWSGAPSALRHAADPEHHAAQRAHLADFLAEAPLAQRPAPARLARTLLTGLWRGFRRGFGGVAGGSRPDAQPRSSPRDEELATHQSWARALADHYMPLYRGAFVAAYLLGASAVLTALVLLLYKATRACIDPAGRLHGLMQAIHGVELALLIALLSIVVRARLGRWHERAIDYRILAELLRHTRWLAPLGLAAPNTRPRAHLAGEVDLTLTWVVAHYRAVLRSVGVPAGRLLRSDLLEQRRILAEEWLAEQVDYHQAAAARHHVMGKTLERWVKTCFVGAFVACVAGFLVPAPWNALCAALAAGLPAIAAACHGIRTQGELDRLAKRSRSMVRRLGELRRRLLEIPAETLTWPELNDRARQASQAMIEELDDWQALARGLEIPTP